MIKKLDDYLDLKDYFYTKGKKGKKEKWNPQKTDEEWEISITAYSRRYIEENLQLFQQLLHKMRIEDEENEESL